MTKDDTLEARDRKRLQNRAAQKSYRRFQRDTVFVIWLTAGYMLTFQTR
jgi:hypothetical protein